VYKKLFATYIVINCIILQSVYAQQKTYWQQQVNYVIDVSLNDANNTLTGFVKMEYSNNSPDTLHYIWIHLWPNAYKNDRTAFSDQHLENGSTSFYFANEDKRGYINQLDFRVNSITATTEDHPQHQDIVKLLLPQPLAPGSKCKVETPFHVKLPYNFSRGGHVNQAYQLTQWYPKPAVYDKKGWHPMPYLDQGEFYSEFGNYEVQITVPDNYVVAATGNLQDENEIAWLQKRKNYDRRDFIKKLSKKIPASTIIPSSATTKTLHYKQNNVHDFAWFADKTFSVKNERISLPSGKKVNAWIFYYAENESLWQNSMEYVTTAITTKSKWLAEYPYNVVNVVEDVNDQGGMEYPTITILGNGGSKKALDFVINHEIGHNWFYGILASNERQHPWMDEGMNSYYDSRYAIQQYGEDAIDVMPDAPGFIKNKMPKDIRTTILQTLITIKKDQPIETASADFTADNYNMIAYSKAAQWMQLLEKELGSVLFDSAMKQYYTQWQFKHPYPEDFKQIMEQVSGKNLSAIFNLLQKKGSLTASKIKKDIRFAPVVSLKETDKHNYIFAAPAVGYNFYDGVMLGGLLHNYTLLPSKLRFVVAPLYATKSKSVNGIASINYTWRRGNKGQQLITSLGAASFNSDSFTDSTGTINNLRFTKLAPAIKYVFGNKNPRSAVIKYLQWKTFIIGEQQLRFQRDTVRQIDIITYPVQSRYLNQLQFNIVNNRVLYPYTFNATTEQGDGFVRTAATATYYFNYAKGGGLNLRVFAGKFFYLGDKTFIKQFATDPYHLNLTGPKGYEDYTYSNYFIGRSEFETYRSQQIMIRDGGFKVRTDLLGEKIGKTDDWLAAANFTTTIPDAINPLQVLPIKLPLRFFFDIGTYAEAWKKNAATSRFLYDAGLQLSLFKNTVNIYMPLLYSKVYKDYFKSTITEPRLTKNISFSIDIQNISFRKFIPQLAF
jgi:hypothetical protein